MKPIDWVGCVEAPDAYCVAHGQSLIDCTRALAQAHAEEIERLMVIHDGKCQEISDLTVTLTALRTRAEQAERRVAALKEDADPDRLARALADAGDALAERNALRMKLEQAEREIDELKNRCLEIEQLYNGELDENDDLREEVARVMASLALIREGLTREKDVYGAADAIRALAGLDQ
jgi:predicted  nucleic acid-binding Zn-ribbon protein